MKKFNYAFLTLLCFLWLTACGTGTEAADSKIGNQPCSDTIFAMDTVMDLQVYGPEELLLEAEERIASLEKKLSVTDETSEIYALNEKKSGIVSDDTAELLSRSLELCDFTRGALDISIYPVLRAWGFTTGDYHVPDAGDIYTLRANVDYTKITIDHQNHVSIADGMEIDLGSVAKGYAGSQVIADWKAQGVTSALLNLGGNVHALGAKPDGSPWRIAIADPLENGNLGVMDITDKAVITSGGYERYFEENGETYWHIIDPKTGLPADSGLISVTVVGTDGVLCDALSTALFVMGLEEAADLWRTSNNFEAVFVAEDGSVTVTEGLTDCFSPTDTYRDAEVQVLRRENASYRETP